MSSERIENLRREDFMKSQSLRWLKIKPTFPMLEKDPKVQEDFLSVIQHLVESILPDDFWLGTSEFSYFSPSIEEISKQPLSAESYWSYRLMKLLPLFSYSFPEEAPCSLPVSFLCPADYTNGVARYAADTLTRWMVPGKHLSITGSISLNFQFEHCPSQRFFVVQEFLGISDRDDLEIVRTTLPSLIQEMKMNIMAVYHARYIASLRSISLEQKNKIIQENLTSILQLPSTDADRSLYDYMQGFLLKLSAEEKIVQVKKNIAYLRNTRPKAFDRDVFYEMTHFTILFRDQFSSRRDTRHISRVIALHYLFKKVLLDSVQKAPSERHISLKIFKTALEGSEPVLGLLMGMNLLHDSERVEKRQIADAIRAFLPEAACINDSFIADRRDEHVRFFYIEIQKPQFAPFSKEEIQTLRSKLPDELKKQIENDVHPIFMPRNEEELLRNLIILSKQLKYVRDLPQASIHYEKQTNSELLFTVLIARLISKKEVPLKARFATVETPIHFMIDEIRFVGMLKKKYFKEGAIIRVSLNKSLFFRQDYSVDLLRARQKVALELSKIVGEFRDYNGGMILKQDESLELLRKTLGAAGSDHEFLLENYFYSLRPGIMQTVHEPSILKTHFLLLLEVLKQEYSDRSYIFKHTQEGKFFLFTMSALAPTFKDFVGNAIEKLKIPSYDLTSTFLQVHDHSTLGYILRAETPEAAAPFQQTLEEALAAWAEQFSCPVQTHSL